MNQKIIQVCIDIFAETFQSEQELLKSKLASAEAALEQLRIDTVAAKETHATQIKDLTEQVEVLESEKNAIDNDAAKNSKTAENVPYL